PCARRRPSSPTSTRVPYTTLFRSGRHEAAERPVHRLDGVARQEEAPEHEGDDEDPELALPIARVRERKLWVFVVALVLGGFFLRSEEHTSELQSRFDLVCRLLLEK